MSTSTAEPPNSAPLDTPVDHRSLLNVTSWFLMIVTFLIVFTRCATRWAVSHKFEIDDIFIVLSWLLAICTTVAMTIGVSNHLGMLDWQQGSNYQIDHLQKAIYSFNILFILSQSFSKISIALFIRTITPDSMHRSLALSICFATFVWTITAVFGLIFECHAPEVWNFLSNTCMNRLAFYTFVEIASIVLDLCLILLPTVIVWGLQSKIRPKLIIIGCFATRAFVVATTIVQLVILYKQNETGDPFLSWASVMSTEIVLTLGIASACVPYLKPFLQSLNSGMIGNDDLRRRGGDTTIYKYASKTKSYSRKKISNLISSRTDNSVVDSRIADEVFPTNLKGIALQSGPNQTNNRNNAYVTADRNENPVEWEASSQSSRAKIIRQTNTFAVRSEDVIE